MVFSSMWSRIFSGSSTAWGGTHAAQLPRVVASGAQPRKQVVPSGDHQLKRPLKCTKQARVLTQAVLSDVNIPRLHVPVHTEL